VGEIVLSVAAMKVVGYGLAAIGPGIGIGVATYGLCVAAARQPEMKGQLMGYFFIGAAMSEALALLGLVLFFIG
jgi:F-type H+-transporting ATPase subunit c